MRSFFPGQFLSFCLTSQDFDFRNGIPRGPFLVSPPATLLAHIPATCLAARFRPSLFLEATGHQTWPPNTSVEQDQVFGGTRRFAKAIRGCISTVHAANNGLRQPCLSASLPTKHATTELLRAILVRNREGRQGRTLPSLGLLCPPKGDFVRSSKRDFMDRCHMVPEVIHAFKLHLLENTLRVLTHLGLALLLGALSFL